MEPKEVTSANQEQGVQQRLAMLYQVFPRLKELVLANIPGGLLVRDLQVVPSQYDGTHKYYHMINFAVYQPSGKERKLVAQFEYLKNVQRPNDQMLNVFWLDRGKRLLEAQYGNYDQPGKISLTRLRVVPLFEERYVSDLVVTTARPSNEDLIRNIANCSTPLEFKPDSKKVGGEKRIIDRSITSAYDEETDIVTIIGQEPFFDARSFTAKLPVVIPQKEILVF